jgi:hypothetical protein
MQLSHFTGTTFRPQYKFVCYYRTADTTLKHISFAIISESNNHDTVAVHLFQRVLMKFLTDNIGQPMHIIYFSDGCAAQYKNWKNFVNLCYHVEDFGASAEWHFFATSHGKGPCDGVAERSNVLRLKQASNVPTKKQILAPCQLYEFGQSELTTINFYYATIQEHEKEAEFLKQWFETARMIPGTQGLHSFRPISQDKVEVRTFSTSPITREEQVSTCEDATMECPAIRGYVTANYDGYWWLACVLTTMPDTG